MEITQGKPLPLGANFVEDALNFSLFSKNGKNVTLCLLDLETKKVFQEIPLDPSFHKTGDIWHIAIKGAPLPFGYMYKVGGTKGKKGPHRFKDDTLLLDPYATLVATSSRFGQPDQKTYFPLGVLQEEPPFNWEEDVKPAIDRSKMIIYEMHVRFFTKKADCDHKGTFLGMIEKIPYLKDLGVSTVELMPIFEFNECEYSGKNPKTGESLYNAWGYSTVNFFSLMNRYATSYKTARSEFKELVKQLHKAGIEVILDVVYNHTAEGGGMGPTYSFRGIDNKVYYMLTQDNIDFNFTGCGNTFNANHPVCRSFILDSLRFFVSEMHVDGFRFDLASALTRNPMGQPLQYPPLIEEIAHDPVLSGAKLIVEPWDAGGLYQVGSFFPHENRFSEWNGAYRDTVRAFISGNSDARAEFATKISGSSDLYGNRAPSCSINFITAHDGFTLKDLVSYNYKHNLANGEKNRDGQDNNTSYNMGHEGVSFDPIINLLRERQMKNFLVTLFFSKGVPMLLMGDEYGHTKEGNNNTWCQDNKLNEFDWEKASSSSLYRFVKLLIRFRKEHLILSEDRFYGDEELIWMEPDGSPVVWEDPAPHLCFQLKTESYDLFYAINISQEEVIVKLPENHHWCVVINTGSDVPNDFYEENTPPIENNEFKLSMRSLFVAKTSHPHTNKSDTSP